ncbi:MAG: hypothetical protein ACOH18_01905 [Candidatus Saccharimonadaceae bacterium]
MGKRTIITALTVLVVLLLVIGVIALVRGFGHDKTDPYDTSKTPSSKTDTTDNSANDDSSQKADPTNPDANTSTDTSNNQAAPDPATVTTVDIAPMSITVSYIKGVGGFDYQVLRTSNGTRYVEFSSSELVGTKCTNDIGVFASILADPETNESTTLAKTTTMDGTKYGLSLEPSTCTSNAEKLQAYQKSFSDAFSLLKKMN